MWQLCEVLLKLKGYVIPLHHPFHFSSTPKTAYRKLFNCSCLIIVSEEFLSRHHSYRSMENYSHFCGCTHSGAIKRDLYICRKDQHNEIMNAFRSLIPLPYFFSSILLLVYNWMQMCPLSETCQHTITSFSSSCEKQKLHFWFCMHLGVGEMVFL